MVRRQITAGPLIHPAIAKYCSPLARVHTLMSCCGNDREAASLLSGHPRNVDGATLLVHLSDDKMLIAKMGGDSAFHGNVPTQIAAAHRTKAECLGSVPDLRKGSLVRVGN